MNSAGDRFSEPPSYDDVVARYGLHILNHGSDFQPTANGDVALTADGDLKLGDNKFNSMFRLVVGWRFNEPILARLFELVTSSKEDFRKFNETLDHALSSLAQSWSPEAVARYHSVNDDIGTSEFGGAVCAGAMLIVLNNLLSRFKNELQPPTEKWEKGAPLIGGFSFAAIIAAGANNFRHHHEWARCNPPTSQQLKSIRAIAAALGKPIADDGYRHPFRSNVCPELLDVLCGGTYEELNRKFFEFANSMID
jgi:hypothetical protein